MAFNSLPPESS
ncbi:unnamed protein product [Oppiella nova]|uniref:Uncharacterized protein n=1 Tax=Oppiella nova TaxID=334625 RepID=A0A7R9M504_9ACAR|nr:unnamed protein product [Oppiella nova]CAG2170761.1 unnamed protein product [Oppiella nova]